MRVIAGKYRGRPLISPDGDRVRPTSDKIKESIFAMIQFDVREAVFIDLFAGSGAMGIEALSRGASKVYFVDNSIASIDLTKSNIAKVKVDNEDNYQVLLEDYLSALRRIKDKVDIIFIDAPYKDKPLDDVLAIVRSRDMLSSGGKIIYEHLYEDGASSLGDDFYLDRCKKYGTIQVEVILKR